VVTISAAIITFNEQDNIGRCLDSLADIADEILVVDAYSTDETADICAANGVHFVKHKFEGHIQQKNYAMASASSDHILSLDADEALSDRLKESIHKAKQNWHADAFCFNRRTNYCGKWIKHSGWYPDRKIRLWDRKKGRWGGVNPHDRVVMDEGARIGHLEGDLLHYSYTSSHQHLEQMNLFSSIAAEAAYQSGKRTRVLTDIVFNPVFTFLKKYLLQLGFLDGEAGLRIAANAAYGKFLKYTKLKEIARPAQKTESK
jgi:glycosyltransferase involved in cell wall biosynthesis